MTLRRLRTGIYDQLPYSANSTVRLQSINAARPSSSISILRGSTQRVSQQLSTSPTDPLTLLRKRQRQPTDHHDEAEFEPTAAKRLRVSSSSSVTGKLAGHGYEVNDEWRTEVIKRLKAADKGTVKSQQSSPTFECANLAELLDLQQINKATRTNYEGRPWQRLMKKSADGSKWFHDVQNRPDTSSKSLSDESSWTTVHASTRNKKQHLRKPELNTTDGLLAITNSMLSDLPQEEDSSLKDETHSASDSKTKQQLQEEVEALALQNAQKDAQIEKLKQHLKVKTQKGCTGTLKYAGGTCSLLHNPEGSLILLGNGNYGRVYKGRCNNTGRHLAVKVVQDLTKKAADALEKEVKQLSGLKHHDRIVTYLGTCYAKHPRFDVESLYVFMEFMPGGSLSSYISEKGPLTEMIMWRFTRQILDGVEYLHKCDVIHRDIKGSNIMCDSSHKNIKLADFGSAKKICSESLDKDKTKYIYGTAPWAAPEMLRGEKAQRGSDIWSVGATLVEMLTGEPPYKNEKFDNEMAIIFKVGSYKINPLMSLRRSGQILTSNVEFFLDSCFERIAANRLSASTLLNLFWPGRYPSMTVK